MLQPKDQKNTASLKAHFLRQTSERLIEASKKGRGSTFTDIWDEV
jgi:hypothetical protein